MSKPATKMAKIDEKGKKSHQMAQRKPGLGVGARLQRLKQAKQQQKLERVKGNYFLMPQPTNSSLCGQLCCQLKS